MSMRIPVTIRFLFVQAMRFMYGGRQKGEYVTGPLITGPGKLGAAFPHDENSHDLVFS